MIAEAVYDTARGLYTSKLGRWILLAAIAAPLGPSLAVVVLSQLPPTRRLAAMMLGVPSLRSPWLEDRLCTAARRWARLSGRVEATETYWLALAQTKRSAAAMEVLFSAEADQLVDVHATNPNLSAARGLLAYETGRHRLALENFEITRLRDPETFTAKGIGLAAAYSAGMLRQQDSAIASFSGYYRLVHPDGDYPPATVAAAFSDRVLERALAPILPRLKADELRSGSAQAQRYGIFCHSSTEALGHAILDPYYFLALRQKDFDHVILLGPPPSSYRRASATCLRIVEGYGDYIEVADEVLLNLSWMSLGTHRFGTVDLVLEHYWSLLREAVHRSRDPNDAFVHNAWHMAFPDSLKAQGERFCERHGIDIERPIVVLHARHSSYHGLHKQNFRDIDIAGYEPAVRYLLSEGYQVARIGDRGMPRMRVDDRGYFEIPFLDDYDTNIDPFLVARSAFMIGCQSGPCAYARALGVPLLTVNAVLHYSLLPAPMEMACFKRYHRKSGGAEVPLTLSEALAADAQNLDSVYRFDEAGIGVRDARPEEILASVRDMLAWLDAPDLKESEEQAAFRGAVETKMQQLSRDGGSAEFPIADYLGIALPGYRIAPTVARMRTRATGTVASQKEPA